MSKDKSIVELEREWAQRLRDAGFRDIEDIRYPDRPLLRWHSFDFVSESSQERKERRTAYQLRVDVFTNDPQFNEIVLLMVKHGNSRFDRFGIEWIWGRHREGWSERRIAEDLKCSKSCIHYLLCRMREWMGLL